MTRSYFLTSETNKRALHEFDDLLCEAALLAASGTGRGFELGG